jgi:hypothetical protein
VVPSDFLEFTLVQGGFERAAVGAAARRLAGSLAWQRAHGGRVLWLVELPNSAVPSFLLTGLAAAHFHSSGEVGDAGLEAVRYVRSG